MVAAKEGQVRGAEGIHRKELKVRARRRHGAWGTGILRGRADGRTEEGSPGHMEKVGHGGPDKAFAGVFVPKAKSRYMMGPSDTACTPCPARSTMRARRKRRRSGRRRTTRMCRRKETSVAKVPTGLRGRMRTWAQAPRTTHLPLHP